MRLHKLRRGIFGLGCSVAIQVSSAKTSARSRRQPLQTVLVVEPTEDRSRHDPRVTRELVARNQERRQPRRWLGKARAEACVRAAAIGVCLPCAKNPSPGVLAERDQEVQALPAETAEQSFTDRVRPGRLNRGTEDPGTQTSRSLPCRSRRQREAGHGSGRRSPAGGPQPHVLLHPSRRACTGARCGGRRGGRASGAVPPAPPWVEKPRADWTPTPPGADTVQGSAP